MAVPAVAAPRALETPSRVKTLLTVTCLAPVLVLVNYSAPLITIPDITADLGATPAAQTWILNGTPLGLAASLLVTGTLADNFGRRRWLIIGAGLTAVASAGAALATDPMTLLAARIVQGVAGAALLSASLGKLGHAFTDPTERGRATGLWAAAMGGGLAVAPVAAGGLTALAGWRGINWLAAGFGLTLAIAATRLPESKARQRRPVDLAGIGTLAATVTAGLATITVARDGWDHPAVPGLAAATVLGVIGFVLIERRRRAPMLDLRLFRHRPFLVSTIGSALNGVLIVGTLSLLPSLWQTAHGMSALETAAVFSIWAAASFAAALVARRVTIAPATLLAIGLGIAASQVFLAGTVADWSLWQALAAYLVSGIGAGLGNTANARLAVESVPAAQASMGSGAANTARYIGSSVGVAVVAALIAGHGAATGMNIALAGSAVLLVAAALVTRWAGRAR